MSRKSKAKKAKYNFPSDAQKSKAAAYSAKETGKSILEIILLAVIRFAVYLSLFTPFILGNRYYFPFVGPKSLYFMAFCEVVFFAWLILAGYKREYLPKFNAVLAAFSVFLLVFILSGILGVDWSHSFWSKFERMTGILMWLHLFAFFLAVSSSFKKIVDWKKVFLVSIFVAMLVSLLSMLELWGWSSFLPFSTLSLAKAGTTGIKALKYSDRGGFTLGNTSFLGTYILFNIFLAFYIFFSYGGISENRKVNLGLRIYCVFAIGLGILSLYRNGARAAFISTLGGFVLTFLLWLSFKPRQKNIRTAGKIILIVSILAVIAVFIMLLIPGSFVHQKFAQLVTQARFVNWSIAWRGFLERPILGWGPENYVLVFPKFFNPCLFTPECGSEIWFDRAHNIFFDTLVTLGLLGFIAYLGLFVSVFYVLAMAYFRDKRINFWVFSVFSSVLVAYFIQNLTVFDMAVSLMMFTLVLGFTGFIASEVKMLRKPLAVSSQKIKKPWTFQRPWLYGVFLAIFCFSLFYCIIFPVKSDNLVIQALMAQDPKIRLELYKKTLNTSSLGKYQIRDFFAQQFQEFALKPENQEKMFLSDATATLDFLASELEKTVKESPYEYRSMLRLGNLYNFYTQIDPNKISLAEATMLKAMQLSPDNQQNYWALAQIRLRQGRQEEALQLAQKAKDLEPNVFNSQSVYLQILKLMDRKELLQQAKEEALKINPEWADDFKDL